METLIFLKAGHRAYHAWISLLSVCQQEALWLYRWAFYTTGHPV